jgi:hypothetical protein
MSSTASEASIAELIKQLSEQSSRLARQEVELAKAELAIKGKRAGIGAGMFGAGVLALQGKRNVAQATPPLPEQATESVKEDVQWAKSRAQSARR